MSTVDSVMRMRAAVRTGFSSTVYAHRVVAFLQSLVWPNPVYTYQVYFFMLKHKNKLGLTAQRNQIEDSMRYVLRYRTIDCWIQTGCTMNHCRHISALTLWCASFIVYIMIACAVTWLTNTNNVRMGDSTRCWCMWCQTNMYIILWSP